jgi:hypothetical protein
MQAHIWKKKYKKGKTEVALFYRRHDTRQA